MSNVPVCPKCTNLIRPSRYERHVTACSGIFTDILKARGGPPNPPGHWEQTLGKRTDDVEEDNTLGEAGGSTAEQQDHDSPAAATSAPVDTAADDPGPGDTHIPTK